MSEEKTITSAQWERNAPRYVAQWMIRGNANHKVKDEDVASFLLKWRDTIEDIIPFVPRNESAMAAAVCKCFIYYNPRRALKFLKNFRSYNFDGDKDPSMLFRQWYDAQITRTAGDARLIYITTLMTCRAFCEYRPGPVRDGRLRLYRNSNDVFKWSKDWSPMHLGSEQNE